MGIIQSKDYTIIAELNQHVHKVHVTLYPEYFKEYIFEVIRDFFKSIINNPNFIFLLLEEDDKSIGYAWIEIKQYSENPFIRDYQSVFVHQISVSEVYRNKGFGTKLMDKVYEIAKSHGIQKIELDYWADNQMASKIFASTSK